MKTKWLNALRSGKYQKNTGSMRKGKAYDVLGVLCAITGNTKNRKMTSSYPRINKAGEVLEFMGISPSTQTTISNLNDSTDGFNDVIRYISRNVKAKN
tara:strand:- start:193707 stop:194000 length:294 start_codon:yes stop_codon:yes gene_type:complete